MDFQKENWVATKEDCKGFTCDMKAKITHDAWKVTKIIYSVWVMNLWRKKKNIAERAKSTYEIWILLKFLCDMGSQPLQLA